MVRVHPPEILKTRAWHRASVESVRSTVKETDTDYVPLDNEMGLGFDSPLVSDARFHRWLGTEDIRFPRKKDHGGLNPSASSTEISSAWIRERLLWEQNVEGSNPPSPTRISSYKVVRTFHDRRQRLVAVA